MNTKEWALVIYTILMQMSVGSFVILGIMHFLAVRKAGVEEADRLSDRALFAIGAALVLGILASLLHLGNPLNAPRAILNFTNSWLSREILLTVLFAILGAVFTWFQWRKVGSAALRNGLAWAAALVGLGLVFGMSQIYRIGTQPAWNTLATPVLFYATTFLLGSLAIGSSFVVNYAYVRKNEPACAETQCMLLRESVRWIALSSVMLLGVEIVTIAMQMVVLAGSGAPQAVASIALNYQPFGVVFALRLVLVFIGAGVLALFLYRYALQEGKEKTLGNLVLGAFLLALASEVLGRFLFYATHVKIGL